jgi:zinc metalloprotease ZmpA
VVVDDNGAEHVRMKRTYRGLAVIGGDIVVHSRNGQMKNVSGSLKTHGRPGTLPLITRKRAVIEAGARFGSEIDAVPSAKLVVFARNQASPKLAYQVDFTGTGKDGNGADQTFIVDAASGRILDSWSNIQTAAVNGTGNSLYLGNIGIVTDSTSTGFRMVDPSRGNGSTYDGNGRAYTTAARRATLFTDADNIWGNNTNSDRATVAGDAHFGVATTWDYYKNVHGRNGIFNDGIGAKSYVHVGNGWVNASWYANAMYYGDGDGATYGPLVVVDVAGHEMSHGVMQATANLTYSGESGGLNEANSDIMGTMTEFYANNASDTPDYLVGEKIYLSNATGSKALRYMYNPIKDGASPNCYVSTIGSLNVHYSSGVANHFFYLLAEGSGAKTYSGVDHTSPTCNSSSLTGIGRSAAENIWYRATSVYMTSSTNYAGARTATLNAARDLFGTGSTQYNAVAAAWSAVSVN